MDVIIALLCLLAVAALLSLLILGGIFFFKKWLPVKKWRNSIHKQARLDYENARGTAHLRMLRKAHESLNKKIKDIDIQIRAYQTEIERLQKDCEAQLRIALERHIVYTYLGNVPGIGPKLRDSILSKVFKSRLRDLQMAFRVPGIGETRQREINNWIKTYEQQIPSLMKWDFPGKADIDQKFEATTGSLKKKTQHLTAMKTEFKRKVNLAEGEILRLESIQLQDFKLAFENPRDLNINIENYLKGVFTEWEPVPAWFKEIVAEGEDYV